MAEWLRAARQEGFSRDRRRHSSRRGARGPLARRGAAAVFPGDEPSGGVRRGRRSERIGQTLRVGGRRGRNGGQLHSCVARCRFGGEGCFYIGEIGALASGQTESSGSHQRYDWTIVRPPKLERPLKSREVIDMTESTTNRP